VWSDAGKAEAVAPLAGMFPLWVAGKPEGLWDILRIVAAVLSSYDMSYPVCVAPGKRGMVTDARRVIVQLLDPFMMSTDIGRLLQRDHTTILHNCVTMRGRLHSKDPEVAERERQNIVDIQTVVASVSVRDVLALIVAIMQTPVRGGPPVRVTILHTPIVNAIKAYWRVHHRGPSMQQLMSALPGASARTVGRQMPFLQAKGRVSWTEHNGQKVIGTLRATEDDPRTHKVDCALSAVIETCGDPLVTAQYIRASLPQDTHIPQAERSHCARVRGIVLWLATDEQHGNMHLRSAARQLGIKHHTGNKNLVAVRALLTTETRTDTECATLALLRRCEARYRELVAAQEGGQT
jgi:hypothetical protein